jgi:sporulation protein YlmC with PRC-barrel domain
MRLVASALIGYDIEASDGSIGKVSDFLFDDTTWAFRWLVVDNSTWLTERRLLVHPSSIGKIANDRHALSITLTMAEIEGGPNIRRDEPVSRQMQINLYDYYGESPFWEGGGYFGGGAIASPFTPPPMRGGPTADSLDANPLGQGERDPHLRSLTAMTGYHVHAMDGAIGHVENLLIDDSRWEIHYFIVETRNFWAGKHVLLSPHAVTDIDWARREIKVNVTCEAVKTSPEWNPTDVIATEFQQRLHTHYNWPACSYY